MTTCFHFQNNVTRLKSFDIITPIRKKKSGDTCFIGRTFSQGDTPVPRHFLSFNQGLFAKKNKKNYTSSLSTQFLLSVIVDNKKIIE